MNHNSKNRPLDSKETILQEAEDLYYKLKSLEFNSERADSMITLLEFIAELRFGEAYEEREF